MKAATNEKIVGCNNNDGEKLIMDQQCWVKTRINYIY